MPWDDVLLLVADLDDSGLPIGEPRWMATAVPGSFLPSVVLCSSRHMHLQLRNLPQSAYICARLMVYQMQYDWRV
jgi:hypothetical protein